MSKVFPLKVYILGNGLAAKNHRAALDELSEYYSFTDNRLEADIIDICQPNFMHYTSAIRAVHEGRDVWVEKPFCLSLAQAIALSDIAERAGRKIMVISQHAYTNPPEDVEVSINYKRDDAYFNGSTHRGSWGYAGGGALFTHGWHVLDALINSTSQHFVSVSCHIDTLWHDIEVEDFAHIEMTTSEGETYIRKIATAPVSLEADGYRPPSILGDSHTGLVRQFENFFHTHHGTQEMHYEVDDAVFMMLLITACYYSAFTQRPVQLAALAKSGLNHSFYTGWQQALLTREPLLESYH